MNPLFQTDFSISDSLKSVRKSVLIYETIITLAGNGIKTIFEDHFKTFIRKKDAGLTLSLGALYPKEFIKSYMNEGKLSKINMIQYRVPDDVADKVGINRGTKRTRRIMTITNPVGFIERHKHKIFECMRGDRPYDKIIEFPDLDYDDLKFVFTVGGKDKTISMRNIDKTVVSKDITEDVAKENGNPQKESIIVFFQEYSREYLCDMGLIIIDEGMEYKFVTQEIFQNDGVNEDESVTEFDK